MLRQYEKIDLIYAAEMSVELLILLLTDGKLIKLKARCIY